MTPAPGKPGPAKPGARPVTPTPSPATTPSRPAKPSGPSAASTFFDGFKKYGPGAFDFVSKVVTQFTGPGGGKISGQQAWDLARGAAQTVAGFAADRPPAATPPPEPSPVAAPPPEAPAYPLYAAPAVSPYPAPPPAPTQPSGADTVSTLLRMLQQRQVPPLPDAQAQPSAPPQQTALGLLSLMLSNPYLQRTLHAAQVPGAPPRSLELPVPAAAAPARTRPVQIPLGAVMNAIAALAGQSMTELNESTPDDDPEMPSYLVGDDGDLLVDPSSGTDRAALVAHLFRLSGEWERTGYGQGGDEVDESEAWAEEAGFI